MSKHLINYLDLQKISSMAKANFANQSVPVSISFRKAEYVDLLHISMLESILTYLTGNGLLNKEVALDFTDLSSEFEEID